LLVSKS